MSQQNHLFTPSNYYDGSLYHKNNDISHFLEESLQTGSVAMDRGKLSNNSIYSTTTNSSDTAWSDTSWNTTLTASSPMWEETSSLRVKGEKNVYTWDEHDDTAEYSPPGSQGFQTPMPGPSYLTETNHEIVDPRPTPASLNWSPHSPLLEVYKFVVGKGGKGGKDQQEPYFQLLDGYAVTEQTPARVYLGYPASPKKGAYPCLYPWGCSGKQTVFTRPADLERHYKNVHASSDQRDSFCCDYKKCGRSSEPFTRKDHYRDHLRDYHKEDLGCAKAQKKLGRKWAAEQAAWLAERRIFSSWWRCARCLERRRVSVHGWDCPTCKVACEQDRIDNRMSQAQHHRNGDPDPFGEEEGYQAASSATASTTTASGSSTFYGCATCHESPGWTGDGTGAWVACPDCNPRTAEASGCGTCQECPGWTNDGMGAWIACPDCTSPRPAAASSCSSSRYYH